MAKPRLLFAITVYNGRSVVFPCLHSAAAVEAATVDIDILVLDEASPDPGFSEDLKALCTGLGLQYYRSPRNLGIPRNVNLGLLRAMEHDYDYVIIANSDVLFPGRLADVMVETDVTEPTIGSVTAWSNNVSIFSLPNGSPDLFLRNQEVVTWLAESIYGQFGPAAGDIPAGISFCILIPVPVLRQVGLMDPVFGRGYCEETDWSLRSKSMGFRITLSPSAFTYHQGGATNVGAGLVSSGHTSVPEHELILDLRYPLFRQQVSAFVHSELLDHLRRDARRKILTDAARDYGYSVVAGLIEPSSNIAHPGVAIEPRDGSLVAVARFLGFTQVLPLYADIPTGILDYFGALPSSVRVIEPRGPLAHVTVGFADLGATVHREVRYPTRV